MTDLLSINLSDFSELNALLERASDALDVERVLDEATAVLLNRIRTRFLAQEDPDGTPWVESQAARDRRESGRDGGTLFDTGTLFHSIQGFSNSPGVRGIGTDVEYADIHQFGFDGNEERIILGFSDDDVDIVTRLITDRLSRAL